VPLLVAGVYGTVLPGGKRGWEAFVSEPIELPDRPGPHSIRDLTQRLAVELERAIARRPEEWHMFQPLWSADRSSR
jgi:KDO2-lipid IV(A) lauroyltransferase